MPRAVPLRQDIPAEKLRRRAKQETGSRASRRMLALAAVLDGASREAAARLAGMDRQSLRDWVHRFAVRWSQHLGCEVTAAQVGLCLADLKLARLTVDSGHLDSLVDVAGYVACVREVQS